jgi:hypothetical protein
MIGNKSFQNTCYNSIQNPLSSRYLSINLKIKIHKTTILRVALYECETWSLTLKEEHRLKVFENRVLRITGPEREEVAGAWRTLHNEELHHRVQNGSGAHPASYPMGTRGYFPGGKAAGL